MSLYCPNCSKEVAAQAAECSHCGADFSQASAWRPVEKAGSWKPTPTGTGVAFQVGKRALVLLIAVPLLSVLVLVFGYYGDSGAMVLPLLLGVAVLVWVLAPMSELSPANSTENDASDDAP
jgi:fatty acid desaturase